MRFILIWICSNTNQYKVTTSKNEKHFGKRVKRPEIVEEEAVEMYTSLESGAICSRV